METKQPKQKELTPKAKLKKSLNHAIIQYKVAVRWLGDARRYKNTYGGDVTMGGESWKEGVEGELAKDAIKAYKEAARRVLYWRKRVDSFNDKLMKLHTKKGPENES